MGTPYSAQTARWIPVVVYPSTQQKRRINVVTILHARILIMLFQTLILIMSLSSTQELARNKKSHYSCSLSKGLYATALGIEILCIGAAEIGEIRLVPVRFQSWRHCHRLCNGVRIGRSYNFYHNPREIWVQSSK